ncbi:helix-turn-helix domain-containing protein [Bifidobacterium catenulatum subsp. kashiwanohense]|uniref:helix-turn-helix domain-containing protein n=1 Tax=Bifidobacterium catenulatum TaxID=1686 RepID=UPI0024819373|nr:helix-turn-helix domain-containing protein [Bifidobacterium catenulatum subsp. kashiwanohense]
MSNIALSWAFRCHVGNASAKAVLVYLADRADDDGTAAYPKIATIVNVTELSERTVRAALKTLQERGFIRRGDQRYARLGKGGRNRLPQYCQVVWDLAVESDPSTLTWIRETHTAEQDPATMGGTVDPMASTIVENGESKDVLPENVGTKPISSTANLAGLENDSETALQIPQGQHCESCTPSTANAAPPALQISQGCIYKDKTLQVNPPSKPSFPSAPTGHLPASGATAAEKIEPNNPTRTTPRSPKRPDGSSPRSASSARCSAWPRPHRPKPTARPSSACTAGSSTRERNGPPS